MKYILLVLLLSFVLIGCAVKEEINLPIVTEGDVLLNQTFDTVINVTYTNDTTLIIINYTYVNNTVNITNTHINNSIITTYIINSTNKTKVNGS